MYSQQLRYPLKKLELLVEIEVFLADSGDALSSHILIKLFKYSAGSGEKALSSHLLNKLFKYSAGSGYLHLINF